MRRQPAAQRTALFAALLATCAVAAGTYLGSGQGAHFDPGLTGYFVGVLASVFGIVYHYTVWIMRPPTRLYWRRGWEYFLSRKHAARYFWTIPRALVLNLALQRFIHARSPWRWLMHVCLFWGVTLSFALCLSLTFGWLHFEAVDMERYRAYFLGLGTLTFVARSWLGFLMFHALDFTATLVIVGVLMAALRRRNDEGAQVYQRFSFDLMPLWILLLISLTGIMLTVSDTFFAGAGHWPITLFHQFLVVVLLLYFPFGKFFHVIQRPASLGIELYYQINEAQGTQSCARCGRPYAQQQHIADVKQALHGAGYSFTLQDGTSLQDYCGPCKRLLRGTAYTASIKQRWLVREEQRP